MAILMLADQVGRKEQVPHAAQAGKAAEKLRAVLPRLIGEMIDEVMPRIALSLAKSRMNPHQAFMTRFAMRLLSVARWSANMNLPVKNRRRPGRFPA